MTDWGIIALGFVGIWLGSSLVVRRIDEIARALGASVFALGATIVAISTDIPEVVVSVAAATRSIGGSDATRLISGTAMGSAIAQIALVLGVSGLIALPGLSKSTIRQHGWALVLAMTAFIVTGLDGSISRIEGLILLTGYGLYIYLATFKRKQVTAPTGNIPRGVLRTLLEFVVGISIVLVCSELIVDSALALSYSLVVGQSTVGALIVGVGTSLPELAVSVRAAQQGKVGLSLGNIIGSNTFDLTVPVGMSALIVPVTVDQELLWFDFPVLCLATVIGSSLIARNPKYKRVAVTALLILYAIYVLLKSMYIPDL